MREPLLATSDARPDAVLEPIMNVDVADLYRRVADAGYARSLALAATVYGLYRVLSIGSRTRDMPPGPPTIPVLGNALVLPKRWMHFQFTEWARQYGDVFSLKIFNQTMIIVSSPTMMKEIFEKRAATNSNRPASILADMITPHNMNMGTGRYANDTWQAMRKASAKAMSDKGIRRHRALQFAEATQLMWDFAHEPADWFAHCSRFTTSLALGIVYGTRAPRLETRDCAAFREVHPQFMHALEFGTMPPVDLFPALTLVPERWAAWKRTVRRIRRMHETLYTRLLDAVKARLARGEAVGCFMEECIVHRKEWNLDSDEVLYNLGGTLLEGSDTSSGSTQGVVLALVSHPDKQAKLREEIDRVVGFDRPPTFDDLPNMPYLQAFIEECHRFRPVGPLGLPHEMVHDEYIDGMFFPKGAVLFLNIWAMYRDPRYYDDPEAFLPERHLARAHGVKPGVADDPARRKNLLFGAGRRVCPGIAFATSSLELIVANLAWAFEFRPPLDPRTGAEAPPPPPWNHTTGISATPLPFECRIVPRSGDRLEAIDRAFARQAEALAPYERELELEDRKWNATWRDTGVA